MINMDSGMSRTILQYLPGSLLSKGIKERVWVEQFRQV